MITKDEITTYICSYALFLKEMLDATKYPYERKYSSSNEQFWDNFPWQDFFPDISLTVNNIPDISLTCFKFPDISRFSRQVVNLYFKQVNYLTMGTATGLLLLIGSRALMPVAATAAASCDWPGWVACASCDWPGCAGIAGRGWNDVAVAVSLGRSTLDTAAHNVHDVMQINHSFICLRSLNISTLWEIKKNTPNFLS